MVVLSWPALPSLEVSSPDCYFYPPSILSNIYRFARHHPLRTGLLRTVWIITKRADGARIDGKLYIYRGHWLTCKTQWVRTHAKIPWINHDYKGRLAQITPILTLFNRIVTVVFLGLSSCRSRMGNKKCYFGVLMCWLVILRRKKAGNCVGILEKFSWNSTCGVYFGKTSIHVAYKSYWNRKKGKIFGFRLPEVFFISLSMFPSEPEKDSHFENS